MAGVISKKGLEMAFNIPVNLMASLVASAPSPTASDTSSTASSVAAIQPASAAASARGATGDGRSNSTASERKTSQMFMQRVQSGVLQDAPTHAEPKSVVYAQAKRSPLVMVETQPKTEEAAVRTMTGSELDRYAPPNPLPTAPILKLAESYAALTRRAA